MTRLENWMQRVRHDLPLAKDSLVPEIREEEQALLVQDLAEFRAHPLSSPYWQESVTNDVDE